MALFTWGLEFCHSYLSCYEPAIHTRRPFLSHWSNCVLAGWLRKGNCRMDEGCMDYWMGGLRFAIYCDVPSKEKRGFLSHFYYLLHSAFVEYFWLPAHYGSCIRNSLILNLARYQRDHF